MGPALQALIHLVLVSRDDLQPSANHGEADAERANQLLRHKAEVKLPQMLIINRFDVFL